MQQSSMKVKISYYAISRVFPDENSYESWSFFFIQQQYIIEHIIMTAVSAPAPIINHVVSKMLTSADFGDSSSHIPPEPSSTISPEPKSPEPPYKSSSSDVYFFAANVPIMRLNMNGNIVFFYLKCSCSDNLFGIICSLRCFLLHPFGIR